MSTTSTGGFNVSGGQIVGPNGQPFKAQGIDILESTLGSVVTNASGGPLLNYFPGTNMVRIAMESGYNSYNDAAFVNAVNWLTAKGIVVEIGNYNTNGSVATGQGLTDELNWYSALATKYSSNPYVWFSTDNEPTDSNTFQGATMQEQLAAYNAIRATGSSAMIGLEDYQGSFTASNYAGMTNVHWDFHYYNWVTNYSADLATNQNWIIQRAAFLQSIHSADGVIPAMVGEFGNATDGNNIDAGGTQAVQAVLNVSPSYSGWDSWLYYWPGAPTMGDELMYPQNTGQLTPYGQQIAGALSGPPPAPPGSTQPPGPVLQPSPDGTKITTAAGSPIIDQAGRSWTLVQSASQGLQTAINGSVDTASANVVLLETLKGNMVQENAAGNWYSEPGTGGVWTQITAPVTPPPAAAPVSTGTGSDTLVLGISEDAYQGDAQFTVAVDGKQLAGTFTATAAHAAAASQSFTFKGDWASGAHAVTVNFLNDAYSGTAATDRNLYVNSVTYGGANTGQSAALMSGGPKSFSVTDSSPVPSPAIGSGADTLVLNVSEDAYQGNALFTVSVDGKQLGGSFTATALHASGASQSLTFNGDFGSGQHAVAVNFLNDAWGGTAATDRNLYVNSITYGGANTAQSAELSTTGAKAFAVTGGTTPAVTETGDHGSLTKNLAQTGSYTVGADTVVLTAGNAAAVTLGTGASQISFVGASSATLTGGSGQATVTADAGSNRFVAGTGTLDVTGGGGKDAYVFHANGGLLKLEDFSIAKGDTLTVDKPLQGAMQQTSDGQGGTMLTFGAGVTHGVDIHGMATMPSTSVLWA